MEVTTTKEQIKKLLQEKNKSARLPEYIDFSIENRVLVIEMFKHNKIPQNMQDDGFCFEGWAICLKCRFSELIDKVRIEWKKEDLVFSNNNDNLKYNQFLYRVLKFKDNYDWFFCDMDDVHSFPLNFKNIIAHIPTTEAKKYAHHKEAILEREYISTHSSEYEAMSNQLPVGLFKSEIGKDNRLTPRSILDIWAIKESKLWIFELKEENNTKVGIISELMYYANVMNDILEGKINYPQKAEKCEFREFDKLYSAIQDKKIQKIQGVFLAEKLHSLINKDIQDIIELMNDTTSNISYIYKKP